MKKVIVECYDCEDGILAFKHNKLKGMVFHESKGFILYFILKEKVAVKQLLIVGMNCM